MSCNKGKKIRSGQYHNGVNFMRQPHKVFKPGTKVIEKSSGQIYTVLEKQLKKEARAKKLYKTGTAIGAAAVLLLLIQK